MDEMSPWSIGKDANIISPMGLFLQRNSAGIDKCFISYLILLQVSSSLDVLPGLFSNIFRFDFQLFETRPIGIADKR